MQYVVVLQGYDSEGDPVQVLGPFTQEEAERVRKQYDDHDDLWGRVFAMGLVDG